MNEIVRIYSDGACSGNPGPGGIGVLLMYKDHYKEISEGYKYTTNSRMELLAVIRALQTLKRKGLDIEVYSDSKYVVDSVEKNWVFNWEKKGFLGRANTDLWKKFLKLYRDHNIKFIWVKGHASNEYNNKCDKLAVDGYRNKILLDDKDL
jgi:ribonuclease HI